MKVNNFADRKKGLEGAQEDIVMGMDADNHLTLLNSLTHLYSNPVMAAFREYCANASDAHKDSGQKKPFEVTFPHRYEGTINLRIRDYGNGMTEEQITKVYSQYGATTKANNNAQVGGFGLGSKSGLAVSNHLFVNTVANGMLLKAQILKNQKNEAVIRILSIEPTKVASGTEIILPLTLPQLNELRAKAEEELVGYKPSQVKLQGDAITYTVHDKKQFLPVKVGSNVIAYIALNNMQERNTFGFAEYHPTVFKNDISVVMGGVYYPTLPTMSSVNTDDAEFQNLAKNLNAYFKNSPKIILNVPVGSVDLPPHRDSIIDTEKTWASLRGLLSNLRMGIPTATESHLNELSIVEAAKRVGSMRALFSPTEEWRHKGKTYHNDMGVAMSKVPFLYSNLSHYYGGGHTRLEGRVGTEAFTAVQTKTEASEYNYQNGKKKKLVVCNLILEQDKYDEVLNYDANNRAHYSVRVAMRKPRINPFITRYLKPVIEDKHTVENFYVVITLKGTIIPEHFAGAIDVTVTEDEVKADYRKLFPPEPKKAIQQQHCRFTEDKMEYSLVSTDENVVYFGGKDAYGTEDFMQPNNKAPYLQQVALMRKISRGSVLDTNEYGWIQKGLLKIIPAGSALIAIGDTRAVKLFQKTFTDATPLGGIVMDYYDNLDADRKLAVQHAYSLFSIWIAGTDQLFSLLGDKDYPMQNKSIQFLFNEPELISVAHYLFAFKDNYVEKLSDWKKNIFVPTLKDNELAWKMLLPIQSLIKELTHYGPSNSQGRPDGRVNTIMSLRCDNSLHVDDLAEFVNKLTAN